MGFNLKGNRKTRGGKNHSDLNEQFHQINDNAIAFMEHNDPVISVDGNKKELLGNMRTKNGLKISSDIDVNENKGIFSDSSEQIRVCLDAEAWIMA